MHKPLCIVYPTGGGGSWLANLIFNLENGTQEIPNVDRIFDFTQKSKSFEIGRAHV